MVNLKMHSSNTLVYIMFINISGYKKIVTIPKDARKILVTEEKSSMNTIAVSAEDEKTFYLNGNLYVDICICFYHCAHIVTKLFVMFISSTEANNGDYDFGGVRGVYDHPSTDLETLIIAGPLKKPIVLHVRVFVLYFN